MNTAALFKQYALSKDIYDEMSSSSGIRSQYAKVVEVLQTFSIEELLQKDRLAGELFMNQGITFTVYSDNKGIERIFPSTLFHVFSPRQNGLILKLVLSNA
jgi:uncharacterized circularly permuted ATP-grasp superfamily protein